MEHLSWAGTHGSCSEAGLARGWQGMCGAGGAVWSWRGSHGAGGAHSGLAGLARWKQGPRLVQGGSGVPWLTQGGFGSRAISRTGPLVM